MGLFNMSKLLVAGCSFSDYTKVNKVFGEFLAKKLDVIEYIHEARGCGSNYRIWREVIGHVFKKNISPEDFIIVQYTDIVRDEYWSPFLRENFPINDDRNDSDRYEKGGTIIRFKIGSHGFYSNNHIKAEHNFLLLRETFLNDEFEMERFITNHNMFQTFMNYHGFKKLFFLRGGVYGPSYDLIDEYKENFIDGKDLLKYHLPNDEYHLSQFGHENTATFIYNFLQQKFI